jgi:polar amino acid transport system substrate-binding protein
MHDTPVSRRQRSRATRVAISICSALLCSCAATPPPPAAPEVAEAPPPLVSELRIGMWLGYAPLAMKQNGEPQGVEVELAQKVGAALGRRTRIVELGWDDLIPALRDGRIDIIMSGMSITEDRERLVSFCEPYMHIGQMALIRAADDEKYRDLAAIDQAKTRIGFQSETTGEYFARGKFTHAKLVGFKTIEPGIAALRKKKIDLFIHDAPTIWRVTGGFKSTEKQLTGRYELLTDESLAWAVRREDSDLHDQLNGLVEKWQADGEIDQVLDHWIRVRKHRLPPPGGK